VEVELAQELREVVQQEQQHPQCALVQQANCIRQLRVAQEGLQEAQLHQDELQVGPPAAVARRAQQARHEAPVRHQLQPGEGKGGGLEGAGGVQERRHGLQWGSRAGGRGEEAVRRVWAASKGATLALALWQPLQRRPQ
jgi:hypothetical protein